MSPHLAKGSKCPPSSGDKIRLYANKFCPYSQRIQLILDAKEIPYEICNINLNSLPEWFTKKNPAEKVPAIELQNGDVVYETSIIAQYIDEKYTTRKLLPKDCLEKAKDLLFIEYFNDIISAMNGILLSFGRHSMKDEETVRKAVEIFEKELQTRGSFYGGNKPNLVDFFIWPWVERSALIKLCCPQLNLKKENYKNIVKWHENMMEQAAVKKSFIDIKTHARFLETYCSGVPHYDFD